MRLVNISELSSLLRLPLSILETLLSRNDAPAPFLSLPPNYRVYNFDEIELWLNYLKLNREQLIEVARLTKPDDGTARPRNPKALGRAITKLIERASEKQSEAS